VGGFGLAFLAAGCDYRLLGKTDDLAKTIVSATGAIEGVVENIREALINSDAKQLRRYLQEVKRMEA